MAITLHRKKIYCYNIANLANLNIKQDNGSVKAMFNKNLPGNMNHICSVDVLKNLDLNINIKKNIFSTGVFLFDLFFVNSTFFD
jgi:hypothetical protein